MALEDKYDGLQRLVQMGKEKGYVLYDEVSEVLPGDLPGGAELEDVLAGLDTAGIEILEEPKDFEKKIDEAEELIILVARKKAPVPFVLTFQAADASSDAA